MARAKEADFSNIETKIQFENGSRYPCLLEAYVMKTTVDQAKITLLHMLRTLAQEDVGQVRPEDVDMILMLPDPKVGEAYKILKLDGSKKMTEYIHDITCCLGIKLQRTMSEPTKRKEDSKIRGEASILQIETHVQFENGTRHPYLLEKYLLVSTVGEAKHAILQTLKILDEDVNEVLMKNVGVFLIMPGKHVGESLYNQELDESRMMGDYIEDITCCETIQLKKKN